ASRRYRATTDRRARPARGAAGTCAAAATLARVTHRARCRAAWDAPMSNRTLRECRTPGAPGIVAAQADAAPPDRSLAESEEREPLAPPFQSQSRTCSPPKFPTPLDRPAE